MFEIVLLFGMTNDLFGGLDAGDNVLIASEPTQLAPACPCELTGACRCESCDCNAAKPKPQVSVKKQTVAASVGGPSPTRAAAKPVAAAACSTGNCGTRRRFGLFRR